MPVTKSRTTLLARTIGCSFVLAAVACGGGGSSNPTSPGGNTTGNTTIASVSISGNTTSVTVGATVSLSATARNSAGTAVSGTFAWSSSNTSVATVDGSGTVTGVAVGNSTITASAGGFSGTRVITVISASGGGGPPPSSAQVDMPGTSFEPSTVTIAQGGVISFVFTALAHNVNFGSGSGAQDIALTTGQTVTRTFNTKGTFTMTCTVHAGMTGSVIVQ